ncbi:single-strand binding protein [Enterocloster phage PMBT24]|uniref:Single-strand binding protein n=1 Tax=Enterocloster phage PMBT24 TaxID=3025413 RepID=A0AAT9TSV6_9CAUD|nr:single-strand binding protein [Enterocloster phage PMBT24]
MNKNQTTSTIPTNNAAHLIGELKEDFSFNHICRGTKMYSSSIIVRRDSGVEDVLPIMVPKQVVREFKRTIKKPVGAVVEIKGRLSSFNEKLSDRVKLRIFIKVKTMTLMAKETKHVNEISLKGYICKEVNYRKTPGRTDEKGNVIKKPSRITDILLAVNNKQLNASYYIPCIAWNKEADHASYLKVSDKIAVKGRMQSREYRKEIFIQPDEDKKVNNDRQFETRVAYELSINTLTEVMDDANVGEVEVTVSTGADGFNL